MQRAQLVGGQGLQRDGNQVAGGVVRGESIAHDATRGELREVSEDGFQGLIDGGIGVGTNQHAIAAFEADFGGGADDLGLARSGRSPEIDEVMGHRPDQRIELLRIQRGVRVDGDLMRQSLGDGRRREAFHGQVGEIVLGMGLNGHEPFIERQQEPRAVDSQPGLGDLVLQVGRQRERQLIDRETQDDAGMGTAVNDEFPLRVVKIALERQDRASERDALMPATAALHATVVERDAERGTVVPGLA